MIADSSLPETAGGTTPPRALPDTEQPRVLVVDDRPENLVALEALLQPLDAAVVTAGSGEEALRALLRDDYAVVLLDVQMPVLDGLEVARYIRSRPRTSGVPIIFLTAVYDRAEQVSAGYGAGAVDYIVKPVDPFILRSKVGVFIDVWRLSRALRQRAELEAAYESLALAQRAGESGFWDWDIAAERIYWSPEYADLHGLPAGQRPSREAWLGAVHPDDRRSVDGRLARLIEAGESWDEEFRIVHRERGERWIRGKGKVYRDADGRATRFVGIDVDVTEQRAAQQRLAEIERQRDLVADLGVLLDGGVGVDDRLERLAGFLRERLGIGCSVSRADTEAPSRPSRAAAEVPIVSRGRTLGRIVLDDDGAPASFEAELLDLIAERAAVAIENALLYEREHQIATMLQQALLPERLRSSFNMRLSACYVPSEADLDVGGDWYDAVTLDDGRVVAFVGDVVGHGIRAASAMGQLRSAIRALAATSRGPGDLLERTDSFARDIDGAEMTTLVVVEVDASRPALRYACAGHPPPLIVAPDGSAEFLEGGRSAPLASFGPTDRIEAELPIEPGTTVVLYSDGLVERRGAVITDGLTQLLETAAELRRSGVRLADDPQPLVDAMLAGTAPRDDICVLCMAVAELSTSFRHELDADPAELHRLRKALGHWLAAMGVDEQPAFDVLLATNEATSNAIEHGHRCNGARGIAVELDAVDEGLRVTVRDAGSWRKSSAPGDRGRGLPLMRTLMDSVHVEPSATGTVVTMERRLDGSTP